MKKLLFAFAILASSQAFGFNPALPVNDSNPMPVAGTFTSTPPANQNVTVISSVPITTTVTNTPNVVISGVPAVTVSGTPTVNANAANTIFTASAYNAVYTVAAGTTSPPAGWENVLTGAATSILLINSKNCILNIYAALDAGSNVLPVVSIPVAANAGLQISYPANGNFYQYTITNTDATSGTFNLNIYYGSILSSGRLPQALAQSVSVIPSAGTPTDRSGTITTGGTAQTIAVANAYRTHFAIINPPTATETLYVSFTGTATANSMQLLAGGSIIYDAPQFVPNSAVSVFAATTGHAFNAEEF